MTVSRLSQARKAIRGAMPGRMMLSGPPGAGKTRSALIIATVLAETMDDSGKVVGHGPILGIDTERESMLTYADDFDFTHLAWAPPYDPRELAGVLGEAGREYAVVIIDSLSHFWRKEGGTLDIAGGKFSSWKEARPAQEDMVEAILKCGAHVILGVRSKVEHAQEIENGRHVVKKLGMAPQQDDDLEFEMNVAVEMSMDHTATVSKSRTTALPISRAFRGGAVAEMAKIYRDWLKAGEPPAAKDEALRLLARMNALPAAKKLACKNEFVAKFGRPEQLRASQVTEAEAMVASFEQPETPPPDGGEGKEVASGEPGDQTSRLTGAAPADTTAEKAEMSKAKRRRLTEAQKLHVFALDCKMSEADLDVAILNETGGRTSSANDLDDSELLRVRTVMENVRDGHISMADLSAAVARWRQAQAS